MLKKVFFPFAIFLLILGCEQITYGYPERSNLSVPAKETFKLAQVRMNEFEKDISINIAVASVKSGKIDLLIEIKNVTNNDIVIKKPRSTGFFPKILMRQHSTM